MDEGMDGWMDRQPLPCTSLGPCGFGGVFLDEGMDG